MKEKIEQLIQDLHNEVDNCPNFAKQQKYYARIENLVRAENILINEGLIV
jgi:hypothetical protein